MGRDEIEEIKQKVDIVTVIGEHVNLKKAGRNFKGECPFHNEKTPSFVVSPELEMYKCFGCGASGDVFTFLQEYEGLDFGEAVKVLADKAGVKLKPFQGGQKSDKDRLIETNELVAKFYHYLLLKHPAGKAALAYVTRERGITMETINAFRIGFSPQDTSIFRNYLVGKKKIKPEVLDKLGLIYKGRGGVGDRFRGRVMFPLSDHRGNVVGFAGRILPAYDRPNIGKYINSPETTLYHKSSLLYGLDLTRSDIKKTKTVIFVEGELDLISIWQAGIKNTVAIKGTAITAEQAQLIKRYADTVIMALDADMAGDSAARRGIQIAEEAGLEVKVALMGEFKDPDEAVRKSVKEFKKIIDNAIPVWDFLIESAIKRFGADTGPGKAKVSKEVVPILASIEDKILQAHYTALVAKKLGVPVEAVAEQVSAKVSPQASRPLAPQQEEKPTEKLARRDLVERRILGIAFSKDPVAMLDDELCAAFEGNFTRKIVDEFTKAKKGFELSEFAKALPKELQEGFSAMVMNETQDEEQTEADVDKEFVVLGKELKLLNIKEKLATLTMKIRELEDDEDSQKVRDLQEEVTELTKQRVALTAE